ncbi:hypothetical protein Z046_14660 [Pseudomonas aeruginosa VRFPA09]|nr:hypothetical protein Z046_14660 [Pseudomonas aeruginosa VRFPA09]
MSDKRKTSGGGVLQPPGVGGLRQAFHRQGGVQAQGQGFVERRLEGGELAVDQGGLGSVAGRNGLPVGRIAPQALSAVTPGFTADNRERLFALRGRVEGWQRLRA